MRVAPRSVLVAFVLAGALAAPASASIQLGPDFTPPSEGNPIAFGCSQRCAFFMDEVSGFGTPTWHAVAPGDGVITHWSAQIGCGCTQDDPTTEHRIVLRIFE